MESKDIKIYFIPGKDKTENDYIYDKIHEAGLEEKMIDCDHSSDLEDAIKANGSKYKLVITLSKTHGVYDNMKDVVEKYHVPAMELHKEEDNSKIHLVSLVVGDAEHNKVIVPFLKKLNISGIDYLDMNRSGRITTEPKYK